MKFKCMECGEKFTRIQMTDGKNVCPICGSTFTLSTEKKTKMTLGLIL